MLIPEPQEDELDIGFLSRIRQLNRIDSEMNTVLGLRHHFTKHSISELGRPRLLALATHMSEGNFIARHTLAPFYFGYSKSLQLPHTELSNIYLARWYGKNKTIKKAYFCSICAKRDELILGFSYWRRAHHIPGLVYCSTHGNELSIIKKAQPHIDMPHTFIENQRLKNMSPPQDFAIHPVIQRYGSICMELLTNRAPSDLTAVYDRTVAWVTKMKLYDGRNRGKQRPTLADVAAHILPPTWLVENFSGVYSRIERSYGSTLNRIVTRSPTVSAEHYSLAMTLISCPEGVDAAKILVEKIQRNQSMHTKDIGNENFAHMINKIKDGRQATWLDALIKE